MRASRQGRHISGAETLCDQAQVPFAVKAFTERAMGHSKGVPDRLVITVEEVKDQIIELQGLPVYTIKVRDLSGAWAFVQEFLMRLGISEDAFRTAKEIIISEETMRGASLVSVDSGRRLEPDRQRGLRATKMGLSSEAEKALETQLRQRALDVQRVKDAIVLATKVTHGPSVVAELCVSDDPYYNTGYVASKKIGYVRVPNLKGLPSFWGGRVFFVDNSVSVLQLRQYLEDRPVLITGVGRFYDEMAPEEFFCLLDS